MKIEFDQKEIEQMLIDKAKAMGIPANRCDIDIAYSSIRRATVWYEEPEEVVPEPAMPEPDPIDTCEPL